MELELPLKPSHCLPHIIYEEMLLPVVLMWDTVSSSGSSSAELTGEAVGRLPDVVVAGLGGEENVGVEVVDVDVLDGVEEFGLVSRDTLSVSVLVTHLLHLLLGTTGDEVKVGMVTALSPFHITRHSSMLCNRHLPINTL